MSAAANNGRRLADFTTDRRVLALSAIAFGIGILSALIAWVLLWLIGLITNLSFYFRIDSALTTPANNRLGLAVILVPMIGGLIVGLMARYGSDKIRGHGIPEALEAILVGRSRMDPKVAVLKPVSSAIAIGTGGPFGAEGPIIMTGGAFGSLIAQFLNLSSAERKTLLVAGAAGGMAAIFAAPVAAVLLAVEVLLFEWRPRSFIPVAVAAATAGALRIPLLGDGPIFPVPGHLPMPAANLAAALAIGLIGGLAAGLLTNMVYGMEELYHKLPVHWMWWPVIGGLFVGIGGFINPLVLGVGYDTIHTLLLGKMLPGIVLGLLIGKALVWSIALSSGTSGGVLAPLLIVGGALGAFEAQWIPFGDAGLWAMLSMTAVMSGSLRAPLTAIVFTLELTHDMNVLPALLIASVTAEAVTILLLRRSILTEKVARRGHHLTYEYSVDPLEVLLVGDVMNKDVPTIPATMTVAEFEAQIAHDPQLQRRQGTPIVDKDGRLVGIITRGDLLRAMEADADGTMSVLDAGCRNLIVAYPDEVLRDAVARMLSNEIGRLPVVRHDDPHKLVGYLGRSGVLAARMGRFEEEQVRERVWGWPHVGRNGKQAEQEPDWIEPGTM